MKFALILGAFLALIAQGISFPNKERSLEAVQQEAEKVLEDSIRSLTKDGDLVLIWTDDGLRVVNRKTINNTAAALAVDDVYFYLYTQSNPTSPASVKINDPNSLGDFNPSHPTKVVIHGWQSSANSMDSFRSAYISTGNNVNVILVDWSKSASNILYNVAKDDVVPVGELVASLLDMLIGQGLSPSNIHIMGHSLGAHISGVAGNRVSATVARVTGMDPAGPLFAGENSEDMLDQGDGQYVEVIHTCGNILGWFDPLGDSDFYPNGGKSSQPGCGVDLAGACSHGRSHEYFTESITSGKGFVAEICQDWDTFQSGSCDSNPSALMGDPTPSSAQGVYYLATNENPPYAQG